MLVTGRFSENLGEASFVYEIPNKFKHAYEFASPHFPKYSEVIAFLANHEISEDEVCIVVNCFGKILPEDTSWYKAVSLVFADPAHQMLARLRFGVGTATDYPTDEPTTANALAIDSNPNI